MIKRRFGQMISLSTTNNYKIIKLTEHDQIVLLKGVYKVVHLDELVISVVQLLPANASQVTSGGLVLVGAVPTSWDNTRLIKDYGTAVGLKPFALGRENMINADISVDLSVFERDLSLKDQRENAAGPAVAYATIGAKANQSVDAIYISVLYTVSCYGKVY